MDVDVTNSSTVSATLFCLFCLPVIGALLITPLQHSLFFYNRIMASDWKHLLHFPLNSMTQLHIITQQEQDEDSKAQRHKRLFYLPVSSLLRSSAFIILRYEHLNAVQSYSDSSSTGSAASPNLSGHFVKASKNPTCSTNCQLSLSSHHRAEPVAPHPVENFFATKWKHHIPRVSHLPKASGVQRIKPGPLIASIRFYMKMARCARTADRP